MENQTPKDVESGDDRGRRASRPGGIPRKGWRDTLLRVYDEQSRDNLSIVAAGVAFYFFFAIFPAIAAAVSIYGMVANPHQLQQQLSSFSGIMPQQAYHLIQNQLATLVQHSGGTLSVGLIVGIVLTLWSARMGMSALMTALNIVYDEKETRGFIKLYAVSLALTIGAVLLGIVAIALVIGVPAVIGKLNLPGIFQVLFTYLRWPLLAAFLIFALAVLYRFCPDRDKPRWQWVSWGSVAATLLWIAASVLFSVYVSHFGSYGKTYGSLAAVVILLMWFFISAYTILLGGELNAEMEHQTLVDKASGQPEAMGDRDAYVADTREEKRP